HGHQAGDRTLQRVARALDAHAPRPDAVFRLGGDEFAVLLTGTSGSAAATAVSRLAGRIDASLGDVRPSVGHGTWSRGSSADDLMRGADEALYASKRARRRHAA